MLSMTSGNCNRLSENAGFQEAARTTSTPSPDFLLNIPHYQPNPHHQELPASGSASTSTSTSPPEATSSFHRPPKRRAANGAKYDLEAAWLPLNEYMTASEQSSGSGNSSISENDGVEGRAKAQDHGGEGGVSNDSGARTATLHYTPNSGLVTDLPHDRRRRIAKRKAQSLARAERQRDSYSATESESDAYQDDSSGDEAVKRRRKLGKRRNAISGGGGSSAGTKRKRSPKKKQKLKKHKAASNRAWQLDRKQKGISGEQMRGLLGFMLKETDWRKAVLEIAPSGGGGGGGNAGELAGKQSLTSVPAAAANDLELSATKLMSHWRDDLIGRIAEMYT